MTLSEKIICLKERTREKLVAAHDYYADSIHAWDIVRDLVKSGSTFENSNAVTGTVTSEDQLVEKSFGYVERQLAEGSLQQFIAIFEYWFFDFMRRWLMAYPRNLASRQVGFKDVLDAPDKEAIANLVIDKELNEITYRKPADWFNYLNEKTKIDCPSADDIDLFSEAKAARDAMVHNQGIAGKIYVQKSGPRAQFKEGDFIDITEPYHRQVWELTLRLVADISDAVAEKAV